MVCFQRKSRLWSNPEKYIHNTKQIYATQLCSSTVVHWRVGSGAALPKSCLNYTTVYHRLWLMGFLYQGNTVQFKLCVNGEDRSTECYCHFGVVKITTNSHKTYRSLKSHLICIWEQLTLNCKGYYVPNKLFAK